MLLQVWLFMAKYPLFSPFQSVDFIQHFRIPVTYSQSGFQLPQLLLYGSTDLYLAGAIRLFPEFEPMFLVRYAMLPMVLASLPVFYFCVREVTESKDIALISTVAYSFTAFVWFDTVFDTGLYPNFYGLLFASLPLAASVKWAARGSFRWQRQGVIALLLVNALFSHYSTFLIFPVLLAWLGCRVVKMRLPKSETVSMLTLLSPMCGLPLYPGVLSTMLGFLNPSGASVVSYTYLGSLFQAWPFMGYLFDWVASDALALSLLVLTAFAVWLGGPLMLKHERRRWEVIRRDEGSRPHLVIFVGWFATSMLLSPFNGVAWRFALVALVPLLVLSSAPLAYFIREKKAGAYKRLKAVRTSWSGLASLCFCALLLTSLASPSAPMVDGASKASAVASSQWQVYQALRWMSANGSICGYVGYWKDSSGTPCSYLALTDWHFTLSQDLGGPSSVEFNPLLTDPTQAVFYALSHHENFIIVSEITTAPILSCYPSSLLTLTVKNYTAESAQVAIHYFTTDTTASFTAAIFVNGSLKASHLMVNDSASFAMTFPSKAVYDINAAIGGVNSTTYRFYGLSNKAPEELPVNPLACTPFGWTAKQLQGVLVYSSPEVKIWRV